MARMSISMPDQLRVEMDAIGSVNWSALAVEAFQRVVRKSRKVDAMNTAQVVERLQASYQEIKSAEQEEGHAAGVEWASTTAEADELMWLEANDELAADYLHEWRFDDGPFKNTDQHDFWGCKKGEGGPSRSFVEGFVEGAIAAWKNVKDQVRE